MSEELTTTEPALPALAYDPRREITAEDLPTPRVKIAQGLSQVVTDGTVPLFAIYSQAGKDDASPSVLAKPGDVSGVRFYVLDVRTGYSYQDTSDELQATPDGLYPDLSLVLNSDPRKVSRTFDYTIVIPQHDTRLPYKLLLTRTGLSAAKTINMQLFLAQSDEDAKDIASVAFTLKAIKRSNDKGTWAVASVQLADNVPTAEAAKDAEVVAKLRQFVSSAPPAPAIVETETTAEAPALD